MADEFGQQLIGYLPNLRRFAMSLCRSADMADDLVQATCEKALVNRDKFESGTRMDAWLFRILRNAWIDRTRRHKTEGVAVDVEDAPDQLSEDGRSFTESRLMLNTTLQAVDDLPDGQREVLLLVCVEELSYRDAADVLEVPIGTVMSRLARARRGLAETLGINQPQDRSGGKQEVNR